MIKFDQFKALDIRIAKIISAEDHPDADRLYIVTVDIGGATKKVVAGIKKHYTKEELVNKPVVVVTNLEPATIRGVSSEGMILVAKDNEKLAFLTPEKEVSVGSAVS